MLQGYSHTPPPVNSPDVGLKSSSPIVHALELASRKVLSAPVDDGGQFIVDPTCDCPTIKKLSERFPDANWGAAMGPEYGVVCLDLGPFDDPLEHELGPLPRSWAVMRTDDLGLHVWFRLDSIAAEPIGRLYGIVSIKPIAPIPGSRHANGSRYVWANNAGAGCLGLARLPASWLWSLPKKARAIGSAQQVPGARIVQDGLANGSSRDGGGWLE